MDCSGLGVPLFELGNHPIDFLYQLTRARLAKGGDKGAVIPERALLEQAQQSKTVCSSGRMRRIGLGTGEQGSGAGGRKPARSEMADRLL